MPDSYDAPQAPGRKSVNLPSPSAGLHPSLEGLPGEPTPPEGAWGGPGPPPRTDPACKTCDAPAKEPYRFDKIKSQYALGEILAINESVHAPIDPLFDGIPRQGSTKSAPRGEDKGHRPAVILDPGQTRENETHRVMLMTTYTGSYEFNDLPPVLQRFCIPISPHCEICTDVEHLHTTPEWQKNHAWLIAIPFHSTGSVSGRWEWREDGKRRNGCSFQVERRTLAQLIAIQRRKFQEWSALGEVPGFRETRYEEYKRFKRQAHMRRRTGRSSFDSRITLQTNPESAPVSTPVSEQGDVSKREHGLSQDVPAPNPSSSHSRQSSISQRLVFGDVTPPDVETDGIYSSERFADWLRDIPPAPSSDGPEEPFASQADVESTSTASTVSIHDDAAPKGKRRALQDATLTQAHFVGNTKPSTGTRTKDSPEVPGGSQTAVSTQVAETPTRGDNGPENVKGSAKKQGKSSKKKWGKLLSFGSIHRT